jgi:predicted outer membrane repeat protein
MQKSIKGIGTEMNRELGALYDKIYVDFSAKGANTGKNWHDAFNDLQNAIASAHSGSIIYIAQGTYYPSTSDPSVSFILKNGVKLHGGYQTGGGTRDPEKFPAILSGAKNAFKVISATGVNKTCILDGLIIQGYTGKDPEFSNGAIIIENGSPIFSRCKIWKNLSHSGTIIIINGSPKFTNCTISDNHRSENSGGVTAMILSNSSPVLTNCLFINNSGGNPLGGAIQISNGSSPTMNACRFFKNYSGDNMGGAIYFSEGSSGVLTNCSFFGNATYESSGGAIYSSGDKLKLTNYTFVNNSSRRAGGAIYISSGDLTLTNSTLTNNSAGADPGGGALILGDGCPSVITNTVFWHNDAPSNKQLRGNDNTIISYCVVEGGYTGPGTVGPIFT